MSISKSFGVLFGITQVFPFPVFIPVEEGRCIYDISDIMELFFVAVFAHEKIDEKCIPIKDAEVTIKSKTLFGEEIVSGFTSENGRFYEKTPMLKISSNAMIRKSTVDFGSGTGNWHVIKETTPVFPIPPGVIYKAMAK